MQDTVKSYKEGNNKYFYIIEYTSIFDGVARKRVFNSDNLNMFYVDKLTAQEKGERHLGEIHERMSSQ